MQLTKQTDYSFRILMYLGTHPDRLCTIKEIKQAYSLSMGHMMKLAHELGKGGFIESVRGRNGGLRLGKKPHDINMGELFRFTEKNLVLVECFKLEGNSCPLTASCKLQNVFRQALEVFIGTLDKHTLGDLM